MSIEIMSQVWKHAPYEGRKLLVLLALADNANDNGWCWPSVDYIKNKARCSERLVRDAIKEMEGDGWLDRKPRPGHSNGYTITPILRGAEIAGVQKSAGDYHVAAPIIIKEPSTTPEAVVENKLQYAHTWTPNQTAVDAVFNSARLNNFIYLPDEHLDHYLSRMSELKRQPSNTEWVRWFGQDQSKRIAEERSHIRNEVSDYADDGTPNSWKL